MRKRLTNNAELKIVSVVFAVLLWLIVVNVADPTVTKTYTGIDVKITDTDVITNNGKTYDRVGESKTVSVTVTAKRSDAEAIKAENIHAVASMKNLLEGYLIPIDITIDGFEGIYQSAEVNPVNLQVSIEDTASNKFPITVVTEGDVQDGYMIGGTTAKPTAITISGAKSVINNISRVVAKVDVSGYTEDTTITGDLIVYSKDDSIVDQTQLTTNLGAAGVQVKVDMYTAKDVPVELSTSGRPKSGYVCSDISCEPETIRVAGEEDVMEKLESIKIPASALNISGADSSVEETIDVSEYLPESLVLVDDATKNIAVTAVIERMGTKTISIPSGSVIINNVPLGLTASFKSGDDVMLNFTGSREVLEELTEDKISASVDLSEYKKKGSYNVPVKVEMPEGCELSEDVELKVVLAEE